MKAFNTYVQQLEQLVRRSFSEPWNEASRKKITIALNGQPYRVIRSSVSLNKRRTDGIFFTDQELSERLVSTITPHLTSEVSIFDPACGVGNLFIACLTHLPVLKDLPTTIDLWGKILHGVELHESFVRAAKARLVLAAIKRGARPTSRAPNIEMSFPKIRVGDFSDYPEAVIESKYVVLNPPFSKTVAPENCEWASGKVSKAALFIAACVQWASEGTEILAILPEVLRTGSHYLRWRRHIEKRATIKSIELVGQFDPFTDIDVFILRLRKSENSSVSELEWWNSTSEVVIGNRTISDLFDVHVGPVVPFRDPRKGEWHPFLTSQNLSPWTTINTDSAVKKRRFSGTLYRPPFVVIRRTSRPGDKFRATCNIVTGKRPVAVENHLIIAKPRSASSLALCESLMKRLHSGEINEWLNERIRCRHLTLPSIRELPW